MTQEHPITPPPELVKRWVDQSTLAIDCYQCIATRAAQWGADEELEACCEWVDSFQNKFVHVHDLRLVRRPKPPSLKEQALALLQVEHGLNVEDLDLLRRALEQLPD
jgi:hypothetical protein